MDPIANMLTTIRNTLMNNIFEVSVPYSNVKERLIRVCEEYNLVDNVAKDEAKRELSFTVSSENGEPKFRNLKRLSTPGRRLYVGWKEIPRPKGNGIVIISTPQGMMSGRVARQRKLGGELICELS